MKLQERFLEKVEKGNGCWLWKGAKNNKGYPQFSIEGKSRQATHIGLILAGQSIPPKKMVCHKCDIRACVRPSHLFIGSNSENMQDMIRKGRADWQKNPEKYVRLGKLKAPHPKGEDHWCSKLTVDEVRQIRILHPAGRFSTSELAKRFRVSKSTIRRILSRKRWESIG